jgi:hypothetical protein
MSTTFRFKTEEEKDALSAEISWAVAQPLIADYYTRPDALQVWLPSGVVTTLKGLRFSAGDIQALLDQPDVTDLYLMFATSPTNPNNITIIAGGVADAADDGGELQKNLLYDYCEPCPTKCPTNM